MFKFNLQIQVLGYSCLITLSDKIKDILIFTNRWLKFSNTIYPTSEDGIYTYILFLLVSIREKSPCVTIRSTYGLHLIYMFLPADNPGKGLLSVSNVPNCQCLPAVTQPLLFWFLKFLSVSIHQDEKGGEFFTIFVNTLQDSRVEVRFYCIPKVQYGILRHRWLTSWKYKPCNSKEAT